MNDRRGIGDLRCQKCMSPRRNVHIEASPVFSDGTFSVEVVCGWCGARGDDTGYRPVVERDHGRLVRVPVHRPLQEVRPM